jgi:hypothetical protein
MLGPCGAARPLASQRSRQGHGLQHRAQLLCAASASAGHRHQAVRDRLWRDGLQVVGRDIVALAHQRTRACRAQPGDAGARAQAFGEPLARSRRCDQRLQIVEQRVGGVHLLHPCLRRGQRGRRHHRLQALDRAAAILAGEQRALRRAIGIAERDAHQKTIELRLRQRIGADLVDRVLRRDHEERLGQRARFVLDRDLVFLHRLEQRALGLGAGAVDLVGQQHLREHRAGVEDERLLAALVHADADQVGRHQVGGELGAREAQAERDGERVGERGLADPRHILDQQMPAGEQAGDAVLDLVALADDDGAELADQLGESDGQGSRGQWLVHAGTLP